MNLRAQFRQREHKPAGILQLNAVGKHPYGGVHRTEIVSMGTTIRKSFPQSIQLRLVFRTDAVGACFVGRIHKVAQTLEDNLVRFPDVVLLLHTIGVAHLCFGKALARYFKVVNPEVAHMPLYHVALAEHQNTAYGQLSVFQNADLFTELLVRQVLVGERWVVVSNLVSIGFKRTLVKVEYACSRNHLFALAAEGLIAHHGHDFRFSGTAVTAARANESVDGIAVIDGFHQR